MKQFKARYSDGVLEPLEDVELKEGDEVMVEVKEVFKGPDEVDRFARAAGSWNGIVDVDELRKGMKESRNVPSREVKF